MYDILNNRPTFEDLRKTVQCKKPELGTRGKNLGSMHVYFTQVVNLQTFYYGDSYIQASK
jgi:hypothetical protein